MLSLRAEMMAENLLAIVAQEQRRGPSLVFAHNAHLQRTQSPMQAGEDDVNWYSAGALVGLTLGQRYMFLATDASPDSDPGTLQRVMAEPTTRRPPDAPCSQHSPCAPRFPRQSARAHQSCAATSR
jgi:hypothetical protein